MEKFTDFIADFVYFVLALLLYIFLMVIKFAPYVTIVAISIILVKLI